MSRLAGYVVVGLVAIAAFAACGGTQVPQHSGYKNVKSEPWKKAKEIKFNEQFEGKVSTDLDYGQYKRARWFYVDLPGSGQLEVKMEVVPGGAASNNEDDEGDNMDVAIELLDPSFAVIAQSDLTTEDAHELKKSLRRKDLAEGRNLIHVYLEARLDSADAELKVVFTRGEKAWKSDFPNQVAWVDQLAAVPAFDDTPAPAKSKITKVKVSTKRGTTTVVAKTEPTDKDKDKDKGKGQMVQV